MSIASDISALKDLSDDVVANKVSRFAYTEQAYTDNNADGVTVYDVNADQNIPVGTASVMKVNQTVIEKGWRARASSITRMLMNHFLGRISYNLNKINDWFNSFLGSMSSYLGAPNGIATLDVNGRIPYSQLPESAIELKGYWDASTNTPTLADGTGTTGDEYIVSVAGTRDLGSGSQYFAVGDRVLYAGGVWKNISGGSVRSVCTTQPDLQGNVDLYSNLDLMDRIFGKRYGKIWHRGALVSDAQNPDKHISLATDGNIVVCVVTSENSDSVKVVIWSDDEGVTWSNAEGTFDFGRDARVCHVGNMFYIFAGAPYTRISSYSPDGKTWYQMSDSDFRIFNAIYDDNTYVFATSSGVKYSVDGHTLLDTQRTTSTTNICSYKATPTGVRMWFATGSGVDDIQYCSNLASGTWVTPVLPSAVSGVDRYFYDFMQVKSPLDMKPSGQANHIYVVAQDGLYGSENGASFTRIKNAAGTNLRDGAYALGNYLIWESRVSASENTLVINVTRVQGTSVLETEALQISIHLASYGNVAIANQGLILFWSKTSLFAYDVEAKTYTKLLVATRSDSQTPVIGNCIKVGHKLMCAVELNSSVYIITSNGFEDLLTYGFLD